MNKSDLEILYEERDRLESEKQDLVQELREATDRVKELEGEVEDLRVTCSYLVLGSGPESEPLKTIKSLQRELKDEGDAARDQIKSLENACSFLISQIVEEDRARVIFEMEEMGLEA